MSGPYLRPVDPAPSNTPSGSDLPGWSRGTWIAVIGIAVIGLVVLSSGMTYAAVINHWAPSLTGRLYTEGEHQAAISAAYDQGVSEGYEDGFDQGYAEGFEEGEALGYLEGEAVGRDAGYSEGERKGYADGHSAGVEEGFDQGYAAGYAEGYDVGWSDGCRALFTGLGTNRVGDWWDFYFGSSYGSYYSLSTCG